MAEYEALDRAAKKQGISVPVLITKLFQEALHGTAKTELTNEKN